MLRILLLLLFLVISSNLAESEECVKIDWLQPFSNSSNFYCSSNGWYPDKTDGNCRRYFVCIKNSNNNFIQLYLTCPNGTYFDQYIIGCTEDYVCPYKITTTTKKETTTQEISTTVESNSCLYEPDPNYFDCKNTGSFPNYNDPTCRSYFYCVDTVSPFLSLKTKYYCDNGTFFNPKTQSCEAKYACPCNNNNSITISPTSGHSTELTRTTPEEITTQEEILVTTSENFNIAETNLTTEEVDVSSKSQSVTTSSIELFPTTPFDECSYNSHPTYFKCTVKGRFRNANDRTCQTYFLCNILSSGRVIQTKYSCPTGSNFNPKLKLCDVDYECPCPSSELTTLEEITTQTISESFTNEESTTEDYTSKEADETTQSVTTSSTEITQTTPYDECSYNSDPTYFKCTVKGRFRNANDRTCKTYFLCNVLRSGRVIQTKYSCPTGSYFNPKLQLCDVDYECPCPSTIEEITTQEIPVTTSESFNTAETNLTTEETSTNEESTGQEYTTEEVDVSTKFQSVTTSSIELSQTTPFDDCSYNSDPTYFKCTVKGRFRNANDRTCKTYFLCNVLRSGRVIQTKYSCPTGSYFNPKLQLCDVAYECPCSSRKLIV